METNQTAKMVAWLDEERRKDKALITRLEERGASQAALIEDQARRIQALESEIASLRSTTLSVSMFDDAIARLRTEVMAAIEQIDTRRSNVEQELRRGRDIDREGLLKGLDELRQEVITRIDRAMMPRRAEEERLSRVAAELQNYADNLSKGLEEFERTLAFLEEQRRQDTRRISDINGELGDLAKRVESQQAKLELLEELSRRTERSVTELTGGFNEYKQQRQAWNEQQALADQKREHMMSDMVRRMDAFTEDMETFAKQVATWADTHRAMKQQIEDFERLADRVDRRLNEVSEMQRLSEERFRQEWEEFLSDDQRRWRQFTLTNEEAWRVNTRTLDEIKAQVAHHSERAERQQEHIALLDQTQQNMLNILTTQLQVLREQADDRRKAIQSEMRQT